MQDKVFILVLVWSTLFFVLVFAWTNPTGNPPTGGGVITVVGGNMGIATSTPSSKLQVVGEIRTTNPAGVSRLWGQGRPMVNVLNSAGECTRTIDGLTAKISRSNNIATWDGAAATCPAGWWVCTIADRGAITCDTAGGLTYMWCDVNATTNDELAWTGNVSFGWKAWVADAVAINATRGRAVGTGGQLYSEENCNRLPSWCCSY